MVAMNEPLICWVCVLLVTFWRFVMSIRCCRTCADRRLAACLGHHSFILEWYFLAVVLLILHLFRASFDIIWFDYVKDRFLTIEHLQAKVPPEEVAVELALSDSLRKLAVVAPLVGLACFLVNVYHIKTFVQRQRNAMLEETRRKQAEGCPLELGCAVVDGAGRIGTVVTMSDDSSDPFPVKVRFEGGSSDWVRRDGVRMHVAESNPWHLTQSGDMTLLVIMMPAVFVVMAMRAEIRVLQIFLGSSYRQGDSWAAYALWRRCTYAMDLECAAAFQYLTVVAFALLCSQFFGIDDLTERVEIREKQLIMENNRLRTQLHRQGGLVESSLRDDLAAANAEHQFSLTWAGLQGLWSYIIVGFMRCVFSIAMACVVELRQDYYQRLMVSVLAKYQPVFVFTAMLCIYNWTIVQRLQDIKRPEALGPRATFKFIAVRGLLLVGDGQKVILHGLVGKHLLHLSGPQADLLHSILLLFECGFVVAWNFWMWSDRVMSRKELRRPLQTVSFAPGPREPLLES